MTLGFIGATNVPKTEQHNSQSFVAFTSAEIPPYWKPKSCTAVSYGIPYCPMKLFATVCHNGLWIRQVFFEVLRCSITANFLKHTRFWKMYGELRPQAKRSSCKG